MEQLEVENEVMLFADVYEDKKDVAKSLINSMFLHFQAKFEKQLKDIKLNQRSGEENILDRYYLASAWYAICYDKCFSYNGKPLLGLPWVISEQICQLAQFSFSGKVATAEALADSERTSINHEGERYTFKLGINHKEVVLYQVEKSLTHDILFDYKMKKVFNTNLIHFYWCPFSVVNMLKQDHPHLLPMHHKLIDQIQLKIVMHMLMKFFNMIKRRIYFDLVENRVVQFYELENTMENGEMTNGLQANKCVSPITEAKYMQQIVWVS